MASDEKKKSPNHLVKRYQQWGLEILCSIRYAHFESENHGGNPPIIWRLAREPDLSRLMFQLVKTFLQQRAQNDGENSTSEKDKNKLLSDAVGVLMADITDPNNLFQKNGQPVAALVGFRILLVERVVARTTFDDWMAKILNVVPDENMASSFSKICQTFCLMGQGDPADYKAIYGRCMGWAQQRKWYAAVRREWNKAVELAFNGPV